MNTLLFLGAVMACCQASTTTALKAEHDVHRELARDHENPKKLLKERHNFPPKAKPIKKGEVVTKYSHLMTENMCRPQENGYFGSTAGTPLVLEYGFQLEATAFADMGQILDAINEYIEGQVLSGTFTSICGVERRLAADAVSDAGIRRLSLFEGAISLDSVSDKVTGFKFSEGTLVSSLFCDPVTHVQNTCGFYTSQIRVFGHGLGSATSQSIWDQVRTALPPSIEMAAKYGAVRIEVVDQLTKLVSSPEGAASVSRNSPSFGALVGLFFSVVVLLTSLYSLYLLWRAGRSNRHVSEEKMRRRGGDQSSLNSTMRASAASSSSAMTDEERQKQRHRLQLEFGPSFDIDRDRFVQDFEEESSCQPDYVFKDPVYTDYLDDLYHHYNDGENLQII